MELDFRNFAHTRKQQKSLWFNLAQLVEQLIRNEQVAGSPKGTPWEDSGSWLEKHNFYFRPFEFIQYFSEQFTEHLKHYLKNTKQKNQKEKFGVHKIYFINLYDFYLVISTKNS